MLVVEIDLEQGEARIGRLRVPIAPEGPEGAIRVNGEAGPVLRYLTFGQRSQAVTLASAAPDPIETLCALIRQLATLQPGQADPAIVEIIALKLCGAGPELPDFTRTARLAVQSGADEAGSLNNRPALEVDRLAVGENGFFATAGDGWQRLVLAADLAEELDLLRLELAASLLQRLEPPAQGEDLAAQTPRPAPDRATGSGAQRPAAPPPDRRPDSPEIFSPGNDSRPTPARPGATGQAGLNNRNATAGFPVTPALTALPPAQPANGLPPPGFGARPVAETSTGGSDTVMSNSGASSGQARVSPFRFSYHPAPAGRGLQLPTSGSGNARATGAAPAGTGYSNTARPDGPGVPVSASTPATRPEAARLYEQTVPGWPEALENSPPGSARTLPVRTGATPAPLEAAWLETMMEAIGQMLHEEADRRGLDR